MARYSRSMLVPRFGSPGQEAVAAMRVLLVGAGGLGCPIGLYLAGAGVGVLTIVDDDVVEVSNLQRQGAHTEARAGTPKAASLATALAALHPRGAYVPLVARLTAANVAAVAGGHDVLVDATDNPATRYLLNDVGVLLRLPVVSGAALGTDGQLCVVGGGGPPSAPCYRCLHPTPPPRAAVGSCADAGVLGPITGVIGSLQAMEVLKLASAAARAKEAAAGRTYDALGDPLWGKLLVLDGADTRIRVIKLRDRAPDCAVCGASPSIRSAADRCVYFVCDSVHMAAAGSISPTLPPPPAARSGRRLQGWRRQRDARDPLPQLLAYPPPSRPTSLARRPAVTRYLMCALTRSSAWRRWQARCTCRWQNCRPLRDLTRLPCW